VPGFVRSSNPQTREIKNSFPVAPLPHEEKEFRVRPRRPPLQAEVRISVPKSLGRIYRYAMQTGRRRSQIKHSLKTYRQRCAVRATYVRNRTSGQWKAHGRYLSRESATQRSVQRQAGFDHAAEKVDVVQRLNEWQQAGDIRLWKFIVSPEFGEQLNMAQLARGVMAGIEKEIAVSVEWVAVAHYNTGHPHVHIALRGIDRQGREIRLPREFVQHGIRNIAEDWCTRELGYRTKAQAMEAQRREVSEIRYTSLDRIVMRANAAGGEGTHFPVTCQGGGRAQYVVARLAVLEGMGLARRVSANDWEVRRDFEGVLRGMQKMADRQKTLGAGGVLRSDERLPILPLDHRALDCVEGRILVHGEEETGRNYFMLESTDAKVYAIYLTRQMQEMRHAGRLRVNTFVRLRKVFAGGRSRIEIEELGSAESILENRGYLRQTVQRLARKGALPVQEGWGGWFGRYQRAVSRAADEARREQEAVNRSR
jgi:type IV secretory pathway VirD2 relaxase